MNAYIKAVLEGLRDGKPVAAHNEKQVLASAILDILASLERIEGALNTPRNREMPATPLEGDAPK